MRSRRAKRAPSSGAGPRAPAAAGLAELPCEVLLRCFALLSQDARLRNIYPVSKRFRALCLDPSLLSSISLEGRCSGPPGSSSAAGRRGSSSSSSRGGDDGASSAFAARLASLHCFLEARQPSLRSLRIECFCQQARAVAVQLSTCLSACGAAATGHLLEELHVRTDALLITTAWLSGLTALTALTLSCQPHPLRLPAGISRLTGLQAAELAGWPVMLGSACLPVSLTHLALADTESQRLPRQLSQLTALASLDLSGSDYEAAGMALLPSLPSLRHLVLPPEAPSLPASLAAATQLESLALSLEDPLDIPTFEAALGRLSRLTALSLRSECLEFVPPSIARLARLQRACIDRHGAADTTELDLTLPQGPWLLSLRWLALQWQPLAAAAAAGVLSSAPQLEGLCSLDPPAPGGGSEGRQRWAAFWEFAATHPPLSCLAVHQGASEQAAGAAGAASTAPIAAEAAHEGQELRDALAALALRRPTLRVQRFGRHSRRNISSGDRLFSDLRSV